MNNKLGHQFKSRGTNKEGREVFDLIISSEHDLMKYSTAKREEKSKFIASQANTVWTPNGREPINEAYLKAGIELKERHRVEREADPEWTAHDRMTREASFYSLHRHRNFIEGELEPEQAIEKLKEIDRQANAGINRNPIMYCKICNPCGGHQDAIWIHEEEASKPTWLDKVKRIFK